MRITIAAKLASIALTVLMLSTPVPSTAFSNNGQAMASAPIEAERIVGFAKRVEKSLAERRAQVAFVARVGRPVSELPRGVYYTHVGLAIYSRITTADGRTMPGYATYNLYQTEDSSNRSEIVQDYMLDFFSNVQELKAGILIPHEKLQQKLLSRAVDGSFSELHNERYSLLSNPYNNIYQNCNEYLLNLIQSAIYDTTDMGMIKRSIEQHFQAYQVPINPLSIIVGGLFRREIAIHDHPERFETVTFKSLANYLEQYDLATANYTLHEVAWSNE